MALVRENMSPARHPWIEAFLANPDNEFADFVAGYARIEPYGRAETPDAARMLFGSLAPQDDARQTLDRTVGKWLDERRREGVPAAEGPRLDRKLREAMDAIRMVSILSLPQTAADLRRHFLLWNSWVERLAGISGPDVRAEFLSTLALTQRLVHKTAPGINPFGLEPLWLALCEQAGGEYPNSYLSIGLLGLRLLPEREGMPSERPWMAGLARWAATQHPDVEDFSRQWWALRALYPQSPGHWREALTNTLRQKAVEIMPTALRDFWTRDVGLGQSGQQSLPNEKTRQSISLPSLRVVNSVIDRANQPLEKIRPEIGAMISERQRYAEATGDSYFLVTTACNVGMRLIETAEGDDLVARGKLSFELARKAIAWQPTNVFAWALLRDSLAAQGHYEHAESVGWETILRFPEDAQWRTQLALLLAKLPSRRDKAESLLRETIDRFPHDIVPHTQLAELLIALKRHDEAKVAVDAALAMGLVNEVMFDLRARLIYHAQGADAARRVLDEGLQQFPGDEILRAHRERLVKGKNLPLDSAALRPVTQSLSSKTKVGHADGDDVLDVAGRGGRLRRLAADLPWKADDAQWRSAAAEEVRQILAEDPNLAYAHYLQAELGDQQTQGSSSMSGVFAVAFVDAMKRKDSDRLSALESIHPGRSHLLDVARAFLFEDKAAADRAVSWLNNRADVVSRPFAALRGFIARRFGTKIGQNDYRLDIADGATFLDLIAANDNVRRDLIESALVPADLALAA